MQRTRVYDLAVAVDTQGKGIKPKFVQQQPFRGEPYCPCYTWATENIVIQQSLSQAWHAIDKRSWPFQLSRDTWLSIITACTQYCLLVGISSIILEILMNTVKARISARVCVEISSIILNFGIIVNTMKARISARVCMNICWSLMMSLYLNWSVEWLQMNTANAYIVPMQTQPSLNKEEGLVSQVFELTLEAWATDEITE